MRHWWSLSRFIAAACLLLVGAIAGCSHGQQGSATQYLYAAIPETGVIAVYTMAASGTAQPLATIKEEPPDTPIDVSVDLVGEAFIANENGNVRVYAPHSSHYELIHTIEGPHTRIHHPTSVTANFDGTFYVAEAGDAADKPRVEWFAAGQNGNVLPNRVLSGPHTGITSPRGLALDGSGRLFVADQSTDRVLVFAPDATGDSAPLLAITGLHSPEHLFVDQLLNLYVANKGDNSISFFIFTGPQSWNPTATIRSATMRQPEGVAADQSGRIAVTTTGGVLFFGPGSNGQVDPAGDLRGPSPMNPAGIFIH